MTVEEIKRLDSINYEVSDAKRLKGLEDELHVIRALAST